ncbi:MAG: phage holin family protein [Azonexaceae bacterium]|uniref:phage holin family protein n=1 Tax=Azonexus sp. R2A61 TaxID=2744443 RepID=UPI001F1FD8DA|nr:phage holin family protein [Azonexus sp. R2A61]MCE1240878.1 phage holin family protein [Azonexaceae bacterium]
MTGNTTGETGREGLFAGLRNLFATLLSIGRTRAELLVLEIEEEKLRLISMWSKAIGAAFLFAIGLIMAVFSIALAFWEQRVLVFGLFAAVFIGTALLLVASLRAQARKPSRLFRSSLSELDEDIAQLRGRPQE